MGNYSNCDINNRLCIDGTNRGNMGAEHPISAIDDSIYGAQLVSIYGTDWHTAHSVCQLERWLPYSEVLSEANGS